MGYHDADEDPGQVQDESRKHKTAHKNTKKRTSVTRFWLLGMNAAPPADRLRIKG
jgi:hypothetical protein